MTNPYYRQPIKRKSINNHLLTILTGIQDDLKEIRHGTDDIFKSISPLPTFHLEHYSSLCPRIYQVVSMPKD